jgi:hypothetical protein
MFNTTYSVNNELFATKDIIFGWVIVVDNSSPCPIDKLHTRYETWGIKKMREMFSQPVYPQELRDALDETIQRAEAAEVAAVIEKEAILKGAEACAVAPVEEELAAAQRQIRDMQIVEQRTLSKLAVLHVRRLAQMKIHALCTEPAPTFDPEHLKRIIAFLKDYCFELALREVGERGEWLGEADCPVVMKKSGTSPLLLELAKDIFPVID